MKRIFSALLAVLAAVPLFGYRLSVWDAKVRHAQKNDPTTVGSSFNHWYYNSSGSPVNNTTARSVFSTALGTWNAVPSSTWQFDTSVGTTSASSSNSDGMHLVGWFSGPNSTTLAYTDAYVNGDGSYVGHGFDIYFNSWYSWALSSPPAGWYDFQSVATHELGHVIGSAHSANSSSVMFATIGSGVTKRTLTTDDQYVPQYLYGGVVTAVAGSGPSGLSPNVTATQTFYLHLTGNTIRPTSSQFFLDISCETPNTTISINSHGFTTAGYYGPGNTIYTYYGQAISATYPLISGQKASPAPGDYPITINVRTSNTSGSVVLKYRVSYIDTTAQEHAWAYYNGGDYESVYHASGDLDPRLSGVNDQQGYPVYTLSIPICSPPGSFSTTSPYNGEQNVSTNPHLTWNASSNAGSYIVHFGNTNPPISQNDRTVCCNSFDPAAYYGNLSPGTLHYWSVDAVSSCDGTTKTANSNGVTSFRTCSKPASFNLSSPSNGSTQTTSVTFTWQPSQAADFYALHLGTSPNAGVYATPSGTSYGPIQLASGTTYYWYVEGVSNCDGTLRTSNSGGNWSFTTCGAPGAFDLTSPANGATSVTTTPTLNWQAAAGAGGYLVHFGTSFPPQNTYSSNTNSYSPGALSANTTYYWWVEATSSCDSSRTGDTSGIFTFTTAGSGGTPARYDFNGDSRADVLWRNANSGYNYLYLMNGIGLSAEGTINVVPDATWKIVGKGDFNNDGRTDILWRNDSTGTNYIYFMNGLAKIGEGTINQADLQWKVAGVGDFNNDGRADILWRNSSTGQNWIYLMNGTTIQLQGSIGSVDPQWQVMGVGDFNADHYADILWFNNQTGTIYIYLMNGLARASEGTVGTVDLVWKIVGVGDFNADGRDDVLWRNSSDGRSYLYLMNGLSIVSQGVVGTADPSWYVAMVGDFNADGKADVLWRNDANGYNYIYLMNGLTIASQGTLNIVDPAWKVQ